jgi:hypothetical protein
MEQSRDPASDASRNLGDLCVAGRSQPVESESLPIVLTVDAVEHQHMQVDIQIQGVAKPLHEGDGSALRVRDSGVLANPTSERSKDRLHKDAEDFAHKACVICQAVAKGERERENPLAYGNLGENTIDKMRCGVGHAAAAA